MTGYGTTRSACVSCWPDPAVTLSWGFHDHRLFECISRDLKQILPERTLSQTQKAGVDDLSSTECMTGGQGPEPLGFWSQYPNPYSGLSGALKYPYILCFCVVSADVYWASRAEKIHFPNKSVLVSQWFIHCQHTLKRFISLVAIGNDGPWPIKDTYIWNIYFILLYYLIL